MFFRSTMPRSFLSLTMGMAFRCSATMTLARSSMVASGPAMMTFFGHELFGRAGKEFLEALLVFLEVAVIDVGSQEVDVLGAHRA